MAAWHAVQRLLLVAVLAVGIAGMHTLGHPSGGSHSGAAHAVAVHSAPQPIGEAMAEPIRHVASHSAAMIAVAGHPALGGLDLGLDPSTMCLAILVGVALMALIAALAFGCRRDVPFVPHLRQAVAVVGRGPPLAITVGLRLANLSVQRT
jgi:hypothetical protein